MKIKDGFYWLHGATNLAQPVKVVDNLIFWIGSNDMTPIEGLKEGQFIFKRMRRPKPLL